MSAPGRIIAAVGPASVTVIGGSVTAMSIAAVLVAAGGAAALGLAGYGVYRYFTTEGVPPQLPGSQQIVELPAATENEGLIPLAADKKSWWKVWG